MRLSPQPALNAVSLLLDVGVLLVTPAHELDFANPLACDLLGAAGKAELERIWPELRPRFEPALAESARRDSPVSFDLEMRGGEAPLSVSCEVYRLTEDDCDAFLVLLRDRTMLAALRTDLILASQLKGLALLYRAIAHELRAPLHSMALNLELLRVSIDDASTLEDEEKSEQIEYLTVLQEELKRLNRSLQTVVIETAPAPAVAEQFDARDLVTDVERLVRPQARLQRVELTLSLPAEPVDLSAQRDRLKQALLNVAINALEVMPGGGRLGLRLEAGTGRVELIVTDDGPGMPATVRRRVFELHFTTKAAGTGIGLYVARSIVEAHGGEIVAESAVGQGSTFRLRIPSLPSLPSASSAPSGD